MKNIRKTLIGAVLATVFLPNVASAAFLTNWKLDIDGPLGAAPKTVINEFMDLTGVSYVKNTFAGPPGAFTFTDSGAFVSSTHDGGASYASPGSAQLTQVLTGATGSGNLATGINFSAGGQLNFIVIATLILLLQQVRWGLIPTEQIMAN